MAREDATHKRPRHLVDDDAEFKKPRRSGRLQRNETLDTEDSVATEARTPRQNQLPTPMTFLAVDTPDTPDARHTKELTATPPGERPSQVSGKSASGKVDEHGSYSSPPQDTQALPSQFVDPNAAYSDEVKDEVKEGVWGYLLPLGGMYGARSLVLKRRDKPGDDAQPSKKKAKTAPAPTPASQGYLIGRHRECDVMIDDPSVSNRHCLIYAEHKNNATVAVLEDLSTNGTYVMEAMVGRNQRRELEDMDEIAIHDRRYLFRYPKVRSTSRFHQQYLLQDKLGKGHFATVYMCIERATGQRFAVKKFTQTPGLEDRAKTDGLQQEIAVLMGVHHANVLCLKETFEEPDAVYLVLELATEGELFNYIVQHSKLSEHDTRKLFRQLFAGVKYLHERNIVHRDIKPENILLVDRDLHVKLADFGLAKIIGEESFTTTLCGTPSYVAPEILADATRRNYTKAVDIWSLGVVLYICLCGFPPFSDELRSHDFPYTMSQQIRDGRFTFPSPYWDPIGDPALDLIDSMLVVNPSRRFTIDDCINHPWMQAAPPSVDDSTDGLVGGLSGLAVNRRTVGRERTLISHINAVEFTEVPGGANQTGLKVFTKKDKKKDKEARPADNADAGAFMEHGERGDPALFDSQPSEHKADDVAVKKADKAKGKAKGKAKR